MVLIEERLLRKTAHLVEHSNRPKNKKPVIEETRFINILSKVATVVAILMYVSYISQIKNNLQGNYGAPLQPLVAALNCTLWCIYAYFKQQRDWPVFWANFPGIIFGLITFITCLH